MTSRIGPDLDAVYDDPAVAGNSPLPFGPGDIVWTNGGKAYKFLQYDTGVGSVAAVAVRVAYYHTEDGHKLNRCTSDVSDGDHVGAGVLQSAPTDGQYCWVQIKGFATLSVAFTAGADGDPLTPFGATDGTLDLTAAVTDPICAFAGDASDNEIICDFVF